MILSQITKLLIVAACAFAQNPEEEEREEPYVKAVYKGRLIFEPLTKGYRNGPIQIGLNGARGATYNPAAPLFDAPTIIISQLSDGTTTVTAWHFELQKFAKLGINMGHLTNGFGYSRIYAAPNGPGFHHFEDENEEENQRKDTAWRFDNETMILRPHFLQQEEHVYPAVITYQDSRRRHQYVSVATNYTAAEEKFPNIAIGQLRFVATADIAKADVKHKYRHSRLPPHVFPGEIRLPMYWKDD